MICGAELAGGRSAECLIMKFISPELLFIFMSTKLSAFLVDLFIFFQSFIRNTNKSTQNSKMMVTSNTAIASCFLSGVTMGPGFDVFRVT